MKIVSTLAVIGTLAFAQPAYAQLNPYTDYDIADSASIVTTVKVDSNMMDYYLEGLKATWAPSNEVAKELGHISGYSMHVSALQESGDFNIVLVINFDSVGDLAPSKAKYDAFMTKWGKANEKKTRATVKTYPDIRNITGEYLMHEVTFK